MPIGQPEFVENPKNRCPVILILDTSGSMAGKPIEELNRGVAALKEDILKDTKASLRVELAIALPEPVKVSGDGRKAKGTVVGKSELWERFIINYCL